MPVSLSNAPRVYLTRCAAPVVWYTDQNDRFYFQVATGSEQIDGTQSGLL